MVIVHCATARLAKIMCQNDTVQVSNVLRPNGEFTESSVEIIKCLIDTLAPGSREVNYSKAAEEPNENVVFPTYDKIACSICSLEKMKRAINEFLPFKTPVLDGIYSVLLQKGWNSIRNIYQTIFQTCLMLRSRAYWRGKSNLGRFFVCNQRFCWPTPTALFKTSLKIFILQ